MTRLPYIAARLRTRQGELLDRLQRLDLSIRRAAEPLVQDFPDQAVQRQNDEVVERLRIATEHELEGIDAALARIASGCYGTCTRCHKPIELARLEALPHIDVCKSCADA